MNDKYNLSFDNYWMANTDTIAEEVLDIWRSHGGPVDVHGLERLRQVVFVVRDSEGRIAGLSTAFRTYVERLRHYFFAVRLMLVPDYRIPGLSAKLLVETRDFLESIHTHDEKDPAIGIITVVEHPGLKRYRTEAIWPASGMIYIGNTNKGHHLRVYYFKGARIRS